MLSKYSWLFGLLPVICVLYAYDYQNAVAWNFLSDGFNVINVIYSGFAGKLFFSTNTSTTEKVFTVSELRKYTNLEDGLYLAILGQVYDVTKGAQYYAPGETYHVFTGRDASLAFITGEFNEEGLIDDIFSLSTHQIKSLDNWRKFYKEKYIYKGKVVGRYYNIDGSPAAGYHMLIQRLKLADEEKLADENEKRMFPPCNIEWQAEIGTRVWCSKKSGGIERDWVGVPRMLFESPTSQQYRCACVKLDSKEYQERKGNLREYQNCLETSTSCVIQTNNT